MARSVVLAVLRAAAIAWLDAVVKPRVASSGTQVIEVGATASDGDLRYWRAKEAVRQGELRLSEQSAVRTALEARASAITGWAATSLLAVTAATFASSTLTPRIAGSAAGTVLLASAVLGIQTARPRDWSMRGYDPALILNDDLSTELETLESLAKGMSPAIQLNRTRLEGMTRMLRWSGRLLIAAPAAGAASYLLAWLLSA